MFRYFGQDISIQKEVVVGEPDAIAAEAGVSLPTVSKVVNGRPDVAPDTRAKVERRPPHPGQRRRS